MQADFDQRIKKLEAALQAFARAPVPARSAPLDSLNPSVKEITPPLNTTPAKPLTPTNPNPGASSSGVPQEPLRNRSGPVPASSNEPTVGDSKGKAKFEPLPRKQLPTPPDNLFHSNQPLTIGSSPAEAQLKASSGSEPKADSNPPTSNGWTDVNNRKKRRKRQLPPALPNTHPMGTRRSTAVQSSPQGGPPVATVQPARRGDHIPADTTSWDLLMGRRYTKTRQPATQPAATPKPTPTPTPSNQGKPNRVAWKLPAETTTQAAAAVTAALATCRRRAQNPPL
jgi:hypothetical protein